MSHLQQKIFVKHAINLINSKIAIESVLEIGSYDNNGSIRSIFPNNIDYLGLDLTEGPNVDMVYDGYNLNLNKKFTLTICSEVFEHDVNWQNTFKNMINHSENNGFLVFTCASRGRPEHGTKRTNPNDSPGTQAIGSNYYKNLTEKDFRKFFNLDSIFKSHFFYFEKTSMDLYFIGSFVKNLDDDFNSFINKYKKDLENKTNEIKKTRNIYLSFLAHFILSLDYPVRKILLLQSSESAYQNYLLARKKTISFLTSYFIKK
jgi:hypothetical protein